MGSSPRPCEMRAPYAICTPSVRHRYAIGTPSAGVESGSRGGRLFVVRTFGDLIFLCCVYKYAKRHLHILYTFHDDLCNISFFFFRPLILVSFLFSTFLLYIEYICTPSLLSFVHAALMLACANPSLT